MDFFETTDDVDQQLLDVRRQLDLLHGDVPRGVSLSRLKTQSPFHPILILRLLFAAAAALCLVAAFAALIVPYLSFLDTGIAETVRRVEMAMGGTPLPVALAGGGGLLLIAWFAVDQSAVAIGRGSTFTNAEARENDRLNSEVSRLTRQRDLVKRAHSTPMAAVARYEVPDREPASQIPSLYERPKPAPSYLSPPSMPPQVAPPTQRAGTPLPAARSGHDGYARFRTPATNGREVVPIAKPTFISLQPQDRRRDEEPGIETPTDQYASASYSSPPDDHQYVVDETEDGLTASTHRADIAYVVDSHSEQGTFNRRVSSDIPALARVSEEWLSDAIRKASYLAGSFPIQARLEFSQDQHVPFTLVLERATPAMAVRAMMAFVEFLSTISLPRKARIDLISVAHLDRTFHRNVRSACIPYFPGAVTIANEPGRIELTFGNPDPRWDRYPVLPVSQ